MWNQDTPPWKANRCETGSQEDGINVESGDLNAWEFFVRTYDHGNTMDDLQDGGNEATERRSGDNPTHSTTTNPKQIPPEIGSLHFSPYPTVWPDGPASSRTFHEFMNAVFPSNHWRYHPQLGHYTIHSTPSLASATTTTDQSSMANTQRSWSYPLLPNQTAYVTNRQEPPSILPLYSQVLESMNEAALHHHQHVQVPITHEQNTATNMTTSRVNFGGHNVDNNMPSEDRNTPLEIPPTFHQSRNSVASGPSSHSMICVSSQGKAPVSTACGEDILEVPKANISDIQIPTFADQIVPPYQEQKNPRLLLKPLTPYNYYYRDERDNIVQHITNEDDRFPPLVSDFSQSKMHALLYQHWYVDPVKQKRIHRKSHGKVGFESLSKAISKRWHELPMEGRVFYRNVSLTDNAFYHRHIQRIQEQRIPLDALTPSTPQASCNKDDLGDE